MLAVQQAGFEADDVLEMLKPFRIGMLMAPGLDEETETCGLFTIDELGWHQFRETGMYVQIYDDVYDVASESTEPPSKAGAMSMLVISKRLSPRRLCRASSRRNSASRKRRRQGRDRAV